MRLKKVNFGAETRVLGSSCRKNHFLVARLWRFFHDSFAADTKPSHNTNDPL